MANVNLLISVSSDYVDRIPELIEQLRACGMFNIQSMDAVGVITGSLDESQIASLANIEGIEQIEREQSVQIPPPDSFIQ